MAGMFLLLGACAAVPYQQMSDARQAIEAARPVVAGEADAESLLHAAQDMLEEAEKHLRAGEYGDARRQAEAAKRLAIESREMADAE